MRLTDLLALSHVPRWSIVHHVGTQSVADHTFRMMVIAVELCERLSVPITMDLLRACLTHDGPEARTGDIPSEAKRKLVQGQGDEGFVDWDPYYFYDLLPDDQKKVLWLADKIEGFTFIAVNGVGLHANSVAPVCRDEIDKDTPLHWRITVNEVIRDIISEKGRLAV